MKALYRKPYTGSPSQPPAIGTRSLGLLSMSQRTSTFARFVSQHTWELAALHCLCAVVPAPFCLAFASEAEFN